MTAAREAERAVRRARARIVASAAVEGAVRGAAVGAICGLAAAGVLRFVATGPAATAWAPAVLPVLGALTGAAWSLRRRPSLDEAALRLDRAAATDEAFVTALTARDAPEWAISATAERAVRICPPERVPSAMPIAVPAAAAAAAVATGLLVAVLVVPAEPESAVRWTVPESAVVQGDAGPPATTPDARVAAMADAARGGDPGAASKLRDDVRGDLGAVTDERLRDLATALAGRGSADAADALAALARGDRAAATDALRRALGARAAQGAERPGGETAGTVPAPGAARPRSVGGGAWPVRYDSAIRRYFEDSP